MFRLRIAAILGAAGLALTGTSVTASPCLSEAKTYFDAYYEYGQHLPTPSASIPTKRVSEEELAEVIESWDDCTHGEGTFLCGSYAGSMWHSQMKLGVFALEVIPEDHKALLKEIFFQTDGAFLHAAADWAKCLKINPQTEEDTALAQSWSRLDQDIEAGIKDRFDIELSLTSGMEQ